MSDPVPIYQVNLDEARQVLDELRADLDKPNWRGLVAVSICEDAATHDVCLYVCTPHNRLSALEVRGALDFAKRQIDSLKSL